MKRILVDAYCEKNFGDDLFLKVLFDRYENVEWTILTSNLEYKYIFREYKNVNIKSNFYQRVFSKLKIKGEKYFYGKFDSIVFIGGSIFIEFEGWRNLFYKRKKIVEYFSSKNKDIYILGANFGPYKDNEFYLNYRNLFDNCTDICFREKKSHELFNDLGNVRVYPDIIFQLDSYIEIDKIKKSVGLSIIDLEKREELYMFKNNYNNKIRDIIESYIIRGNNVTMFSFCEEEGDMIAINSIIELIDKAYIERIKIVNYTGDIMKFLEELQKVEIVIGSRFHAMILSQVFNQGVYPIIYSDKTYNVLNDIELADQYIYIDNIDNLNVDYLIRNTFNNKVAKLNISKESERQFEKLDKFIRN